MNYRGEVWDAGAIVETDPPRRLAIRWVHEMRPELKAEGASLCTMQLALAARPVRLTITHEVERDGSKLVEAVAGGWPKILSNLKCLLETGTVAFQESHPSQQ